MDEMRDEYLGSLGEELGILFFALHREVIELHVIWQQYMQLYGESAETIDVLNKTAGLFFKVVQDELWDSVLLRIATLTDPPEMKGKKNLTLRALPALMPTHELRVELQGLCDKALAEADFAREHRNKRIAHNDHGYYVNKGAIQLSGISRTSVNRMLEAVRDVMNLVQVRCRDTTCLYQEFVDYSGARVLVHRLLDMERNRK